MLRLFRKFLRVFKIPLIIASPFIGYGIYIAPVFLEYGGGGCLVDQRKEGYHTDYLWGYLPGIKWKWTVLCGLGPPTQDAGNQDYHVGPHEANHPKPIPLPGQWQLSHRLAKTRWWWDVRLHYFARTDRHGHHSRIGWRWDDKDNLYLPSLVIWKNIDYVKDYWEAILWNTFIG